MKKDTLFLIGSPKAEKSTSNSLACYLSTQLEKEGVGSSSLYIHKAIRSDDGLKNLYLSVKAADILVFVFPLYVDSLPAPVIKIMEKISEEYGKNEPAKKQKMLTIINCGFPEASQIDIALEISHMFCRKVGLEYIGGLALGAGGAINNRLLDDIGGMTKNVRKSLELTAKAVAENKDVPEEAVMLMAKKMMPNWFYIFMGNWGWKRQAKQFGTQKMLFDRPYHKYL